MTVFTLVLKSQIKKLYDNKAAVYNEWTHTKYKPTLLRGLLFDNAVPVFVYVFLQGMSVGNFLLFSSGRVPKSSVLLLDFL